MNSDIAAHKLLKLAKFKCLNSILFFTRYYFKKRFNRKFVIGGHHEIICNALEKVLTGKITKLIINIAPRYGKTEIAVKNFIANGLALNPAAKFIHLTYAKNLALDNSEDAKDLVQSAEFQEMFPDVRIKKGSFAKEKWYTTAGGGVYAAAAGGQVTGFGAGSVEEEEEIEEGSIDEEAIDEFLTSIEQKGTFGGAIIIDDPIKPDDANSDTIRERVNNRFETTIRNRVNSRKTPLVVIGQRVHPNDLSGYLIEVEPDDWTVISLPCLITEKEGLRSLWPFKHTVKELEKIQKASAITFETQYQQNPKPKEGLLFPEDELNYFNPATVDVEKLAEFRFGYIDPADEGGDDLSFPLCYLVGNKIYVTDAIYNNNGTDINEPACIGTIKKNKLNAVYIEGNSAWILFAKSVRNKVHETYQDCDIRIVKNSTNKHTRILAQSSFIKNEFVFRSDWKTCSPEYRKFMNNLTSYKRIQTGSKNAHDDAPDSMAGAGSYFASNFAHLW